MGQALVQVADALLQDSRSHILLLPMLVHHLEQHLDRNQSTRWQKSTQQQRIPEENTSSGIQSSYL